MHLGDVCAYLNLAFLILVCITYVVATLVGSQKGKVNVRRKFM